MEAPLSASIFLFFIIILFTPCPTTSALDPSCQTTCGPLQVKYPFGTAYGCGSPRFSPYVTCSAAGDQLLLTTHTGIYPITSISYSTSSLIITPPCMSTCTSMQQSPNLGLDWASPFQLGSSAFLLLSCPPPTSSLAVKGSLVCDASSSHLCASIYTCPSVTNLGLPLFAPSNSCCVYSPANFNGNGELDLEALKCMGYTSVVSFQDYPTDPTRWEYGVELTYRNGAFDDYYLDNKCNTCENSGGACGYAHPANSFLCLCNGLNTTTDCYGYSVDQGLPWSSVSLLTRIWQCDVTWRHKGMIWLEVLAGLVLIATAW